MSQCAKEKQNLRETMPETAAWIDALREAFGAEAINDSIRRGLRGEPTFWASEAGTEIGTRPKVNTSKGTPGSSPMRVKNARDLASG